MKKGQFFTLLLGVAILFSGSLSAQNAVRKPQVPISESAKAFTFRGGKKIKQEDIPSPDLTVKGINKAFKPEKWVNFEVENFQMDVNDRARQVLNIGKKDLYMGPIQVSFYLHVPDPNAATPGKNMILISKTVTYLNVPINKPTNFNVMLSPVTVANLTGGTGNFRPKRMGFEVKYNDSVIYRWTDESALQDWWNISSPTVTKDSGKYALLNKDETPFSMLWYDRYPAIKKVDSTTLGETLDRLSTPTPIGEIPSPEPAPTTTGATR